MATLLVLLIVALLLAAAVLHLTRSRLLSASMVAAIPAFMVLALLTDLARGARHIGQATYNADLRQLIVCLPLLALCILSVLRSSWRWLFWIVWVLNALIAVGLIYLAFFWKVFS